MYKLICFDLDDTLWPCLPTIEHAENTLYRWLSDNKPSIVSLYSSQQLAEKRKQLLQVRPELLCDLSAARREHLKELAIETGDTSEWVDTAFSVFYEARQKVTLYDDVIPVLSALRLQYKLVALTNGNADIIKTGLGDYFDFQISAADVQAAKPNPAMFHAAMQKARVSAEQTLHVGDHPLHDIRGARNAGVDVVWVTRFKQEWDINEPQPAQQFSDLFQLQSWLSAQAI